MRHQKKFTAAEKMNRFNQMEETKNNGLCDFFTYTTKSELSPCINYFPQATYENLQIYDEIGCFIIKNPKKDLSEAKWHSKTKAEKSLDLDSGKVEIEKIADFKYALIFSRPCTRFINNDLTLLPNYQNCSGFIAITFKYQSQNEGALITSFQEGNVNYREILIHEHIISLHIGPFVEHIQYNVKTWLTLFVQYYTSDGKSIWSVYLNDEKMCVFTTPFVEEMMSSLAIGSRFSGEKAFHGSVSCIEIYHNTHQGVEIPTALRKLVTDQQKTTTY